MIQKRHLVLLHDLLAAPASFVLALFLRTGEDSFDHYISLLPLWLCLFTAIAAVSFHSFGMYRGIWRYASILDLTCILKATTVAVLVFTATLAIITRVEGLPRSVPIIQWLLLTFMLAGPRLAYRLFKDNRLRRLTARQGASRVPVLLVGASDAAELFIRAAHGNPHAPYRVVAILDGRGRRAGREIHGIPVIEGAGRLPEVLAQLARRGERPQRLILTDPDTVGPDLPMTRLIEEAEAAGLSVSRLPSLTVLRDATEERRFDLFPIALEDLLNRPQAPLNVTAMRDLVAGRRVLVTGAGGTIGSELTRQIAAFGPADLILVEAGEHNLYTIDLEVRQTWPALPCRPVLCDVRDRARVDAVWAEHRPDLVFHAAALKHVPMVEHNPGEGVLTNAVGSRHVAEATRAVGALAMVQISTDKAVNPSSVMGAAKRLAEFYCQALDTESGGDGRAGTRFITVRFGNVLGSNGSVVPLFQKQISQGGPLTVTHPDIRRFFMTVREAVGLVLHASAHAVRHPEERGTILVLDMGEPIKIMDIARQVIRLSGLKPDEDVKIAITGLRPGEKLYEELFDARERPVPVAAAGLLGAVSPPVNRRMLERSFDELETAVRRGDESLLRRLLGQFVPGYSCAAESTGPIADRSGDAAVDAVV